MNTPFLTELEQKKTLRLEAEGADRDCTEWSSHSWRRKSIERLKPETWV